MPATRWGLLLVLLQTCVGGLAREQSKWFLPNLFIAPALRGQQVLVPGTDAHYGVVDQHLKVFVWELDHQYEADIMEQQHLWKRGPLGEVLALGPLTDVHLRDTDQRDADTHLLAALQTSPLRVHTVEECDIVFVPGVQGRANRWDPAQQDGFSRFVELFADAERHFPHLDAKPHVVGYTRPAWDIHDLITSEVGKKFVWTTTERLTGTNEEDNENVVTLPYAANVHFSQGSLELHRRFNESLVRETKDVYASESFSTRLDFRKVLREHCEARPALCRHFEWQWGMDERLDAYETLDRSMYCLQPPGDTFLRRSIWECLYHGAVPVFFHEEMLSLLPFPGAVDWSTLSLLLPWCRDGLCTSMREGAPPNVLDFMQQHLGEQAALQRMRAWYRVRHLMQYSLNPVHTLLRFDEMHLVTRHDDAFTMVLKTVVASLCARGRMPATRCGPFMLRSQLHVHPSSKSLKERIDAGEFWAAEPSFSSGSSGAGEHAWQDQQQQQVSGASGGVSLNVHKRSFLGSLLPRFKGAAR